MKKPQLGIPKGVSSRAAATGRIAWHLGRRGAARLWGGGAAADERLGEALLSELDQLKGMAMKVGQILSYMDVGLPPAVSQRLAKLQTGVNPLPLVSLEPVIEESLGCKIADAFAEFDARPIGAASIGQVHRAITRDGEDVAVKIRYPEIEESLRGDFSQLARLGSFAGLFSAVDGDAVVRELQARVLEECDYRREAAFQTRFRDFFAGDADLVVPRVLSHLSGEGVLTSEWSSSQPFDVFVSQSEQPARNRASIALLRFAYEPLLLGHFLHADPHPGNQLYSVQGQVTALDFGCVRVFEPSFVTNLVGLSKAILRADRPGFRAAAIALGFAPRPEKIDFYELWEQFAWLYAPVLSPNFEFSQAWWQQGRRFSSPTAKNARHQSFPAEWIWLQRLQWGLWAVLKRIGPDADLATPFAALLSRSERLREGESEPAAARASRV